MSTLRLLAFSLLAAGMAGTCGASISDDRNVPAGAIVELTIVGTWEVIRADERPALVGVLLQFTRSGKVKISLKGEEKAIEEVDYKVVGNKIQARGQGNKSTITIKKLTDSTLVLADEQGKKVELKRKWK